jgi:hypothetical protein
MTDYLLDRWGGVNPSSITVKPEGNCLDFVFHNTIVPTEMVQGYDFEGHKVIVQSNSGDLPEIFTVQPLPGWEALTDLVMSAQDNATTIITICQQLLG